MRDVAAVLISSRHTVKGNSHCVLMQHRSTCIQVNHESQFMTHAMTSSDVVMVDGTFWIDDEMIHLGISTHRGSQIGHLPQSGAGGMLEWLAKLRPTTRKLLIHINNTNPILDEHSAERDACTAAGVEVSHDGLEIEL
jgi:coenzyme PQQ biosynthesis protein B